MAVDPAGNAIAVWQQFDGTNFNILANRHAVSTSTWGAAEIIESEAGYASSPQVAVDPTGRAMAAWAQFDGIRYNIRANRYD